MSTLPSGLGSTIEFTCTGCGQNLRVPLEAAGRQARCPGCMSILAVPMASAPVAGLQPATNAYPQFPASPAGNAPLPAPFLQMTPQPHSPGMGSTSSLVPQRPPGPPPSAGPQVGTAPSGFPARPPLAGSPLSASPMSKPDVPSSAVPSGPSLDELRRRDGQETPTRQLFDRITSEIGKLYVGQDELVLGALVALFSNGHVLIESVPGLGKTLFVRTLGRVLGCSFGRIQFTADLMPSDITGAPIFDMKTQEFRFRPGPVFTQLLLADEINRSPAKTHAALLEIMQENRVTVDGQSHAIRRPFLVLATQNPIESEGTYSLPEAQLDRFMFKLVVDYPAEREEADILKLHSQQFDINRRLEEEVQTVTSEAEILRVTQENGHVLVDDRLVDYVNRVVRLTRAWPQFYMGASPRAGIALLQAARTLASFAGRDYVVPDDVVQIALPALRHRVILKAEAEVEGQKVDQLLTTLIRSVDVPRM